MTFQTPAGHRAEFALRDGTNDWNTANSCTTNDEYHLPRGLTGWAVDVGAHIGAVTIPLLLDNPGLSVIAIEPLPENVELLRENLRRNGVEDRCIVFDGAAAKTARKVRIGYQSDGHHDYVGSMAYADSARSVSPKGVTLAAAIEDREIEWLKIDCEGCEYAFLDSPAIGQVKHIEGEFHLGAGKTLATLLSPTHVFVGSDEHTGPFTADRR